MDLISILVRVFISLFVLFFGVQSSPESAMPEPVETFRSLTIIDSVEVLSTRSIPAQLRIAVRGSQPDGCEFPVQVEQRREGNRVIVEIYRDVPTAVMCTMILVGYEATIPIDGTFDQGTYTIEVNGFVVEVAI